MAEPSWLVEPGDPRRPRQVAVGIHPLKSNPDQRHAGVIYRRRDGSYSFLNLAFHKDLRDSPNFHHVAWVEPRLERETAEVLAGMCRKVWSKHALAGLTYSLRYTGGKFDLSNAALLHGPDEHGFSCATFVLAVFESGTVTILDWRRWRRRGEDRDWQENIADTLQRSDTSPEYQALLHRELGSLRFRPEEVAAGAAAKRFPAGFRFVERAALQLLVKLGVSGVAEQLEQLERDAGWLTRLSWLRGR